MHKKRKFFSLKITQILVALFLLIGFFWGVKLLVTKTNLEGEELQKMIEFKKNSLSAFLEKNKANFSEHYYQMLIASQKYVQYSPKLDHKNLSFKNIGKTEFYTREPLLNIPESSKKKRVILWFPPYHFPFSYTGAPFDRFPIFEDVLIVSLNINAYQLEYTSYDQYYAQINSDIAAYLNKYNIQVVDIFATSMGGPIALRWANDHINQIGKIYLHEVPILTRDSERTNIWFTPNKPIQNFIKKIDAIDDKIPTEFFTMMRVFDYQKKLLKNPDISPETLARPENLYELLGIASPDFFVQLSLFKDILNQFAESIFAYKNLEKIREKTACIIAYQDDSVAPVGDMLPLSTKNTKLIMRPGGHLSFMTVRRQEFIEDFQSCIH